MSKILKAPELLMPSGSLKHLQYAFNFGADAIYAGQPRYSLRVRNNEFKLEQIEQGIKIARSLNKKFYLTSNVIPHNSKVKTFIRDLEPVLALNPHAVIMADPGLIMMVRDKWPDVEIHLSVQANTVNYASVKFWQKIGIKRIILSRELSLDEIEEIKNECPDMELEVFVHGALCIAYSGRCLLSGYFNHRDPNQGTCTNACRWEYKVHDTKENLIGDVEALSNFDFNSELEKANNDFTSVGAIKRHHLADKVYLLEDTAKKEFMPIMEDDNGTYIMNSKDLRAIMHIERLVKIGVDSLKVEGRTKSIYYVSRVAQTYRKAIDNAVNGKEFDYNLLSELDGLANRGYTDGFFQRHHAHEYQNYVDSHSKSRMSQYVGDITSIDENGNAIVDVKNRFSKGDTIDIIHPNGNQTLTLEKILNINNQEIDVAQGNGIVVKIPNLNNYQGGLLARVMTHTT